MFQRHQRRRQAGFIVKRDCTRINTLNNCPSQGSDDSQNSVQFSPFRNESPEPIDRILASHRHRINSYIQQPTYMKSQKNLANTFQQPQQEQPNIHYKKQQKSSRQNKENKRVVKYEEQEQQIAYQIQDYKFKQRRTTKNSNDERQYRDHRPHHRNSQEYHHNTSQDRRFRMVTEEGDRHREQLQHRNRKFQDQRPKQHKVSRIPSQQRFKRQNHQMKREKYERVEDARRSKPSIITQSFEQVQEIHSKPQQLSLSLAEAFNLNCHRLKQRLQRQRIKFSKSRTKANRDSSFERKNFNNTLKFEKKKSSFESAPNWENSNQKSYKNLPPKMISRNSDSDARPPRFSNNNFSNKQNCQSYSNIRQESRPLRPSVQKATKFFIPASTSRSKPITPRQAYQHSLKKWKQLPQVVAKQKQREKQAHMRERLSKMKAHSIQVRQKLKKQGKY